MKKEEDFLLPEGKESLNIDFENLCVKKKKVESAFSFGACLFISYCCFDDYKGKI